MENGGTDTSMVYLAAEHGERQLSDAAKFGLQPLLTKPHATVPPTRRVAAWKATFSPPFRYVRAMTRSDQPAMALPSFQPGGRPLMDKTQQDNVPLSTALLDPAHELRSHLDHQIRRHTDC